MTNCGAGLGEEADEAKSIRGHRARRNYRSGRV